MLPRDRQRRVLVLEALERVVKQFRSREDSWPFRMPHEPLDLDRVIEEALAGEDGSLAAEALRSRAVLRLEWTGDGTWELWAIVLPSGVLLYCDGNGTESRVLASARRGNPADADGYFLERLAESRGEIFGIEMSGPPPDRIRASMGDREFLTDVFVELFEGSEQERELRARAGAGDTAADFHAVVAGWLDRVLRCPPMTRRQPRVRDADPSL
jgi:hypothetical protein